MNVVWLTVKGPTLAVGGTDVDRQAALQKKMAEINIRGLHTEEDWFFAYALQQGYITVSDQPLQSLYQEQTSNSYQKGLFSVLSKKLFPTKADFFGIDYALPTDTSSPTQ